MSVNKVRIILLACVFLTTFAFLIGAYLARFLWVDDFNNFKYVQEQKREIQYCPYCGEKLDQ